MEYSLGAVSGSVVLFDGSPEIYAVITCQGPQDAAAPGSNSHDNLVEDVVNGNSPPGRPPLDMTP